MISSGTKLLHNFTLAAFLFCACPITAQALTAVAQADESKPPCHQQVEVVETCCHIDALARPHADSEYSANDLKGLVEHSFPTLQDKCTQAPSLSPHSECRAPPGTTPVTLNDRLLLSHYP